MSEQYDRSRRELLRRFADWLVGGVALWSAKAFADAVATELQPHLRQAIHRAVAESLEPLDEVRDLFASLFLGTGEKVYLLPAQDNPRMIPDMRRVAVDPNEIFTATTLRAARSFGRVLDHLEDRIKRTDQLLGLNGQGNIIAFGSPTSNLVARVAMGYEALDNGGEGLDHRACDGMHLPLRYELNGEAILGCPSPYRVVSRTVGGRDHVIPNWGVRRASNNLQCPELINGRLSEDYLIISSLPNVFSPNSLDAGHRVINLGGTHREGTSAISGLLKDRELLEQLQRRVQQAQGSNGVTPYWQALILVRCDHSTNEYTPTSILDFEKVDVDYRKLRQIADSNLKLLRSYGGTGS